MERDMIERMAPLDKCCLYATYYSKYMCSAPVRVDNIMLCAVWFVGMRFLCSF